MGIIPVTVLTDSQHQDGSHILDRILTNQNGRRITAIVPKQGRKKKRESLPGTVLATRERLVRMGKGCACCTVRGDLMTKIRRIAVNQSADHIVIWAEPNSDLTTLAKTFTVADETGSVLSDVAHLEHLVMVVDAQNLLSSLHTSGVRSMIQRIELANVIAVDGLGELEMDGLEQVLAILDALNPEAHIARGDLPNLDLHSLKGAYPFDLSHAQQRAARDVPFKGSEENQLVSPFTYRARHPFHPYRLHQLLSHLPHGVLRAKGMFWVASHPNVAATLDIAGGSQETSPEGIWWDAVPIEQRPDSEAFRQFVRGWDPAYGDRCQEINGIALGLDEARLRTLLDACLLTKDELRTPENWPAMNHPFSWPK